MRRLGPARGSAYGSGRAAGPVYRLGPSSRPPRIRDDTTVHVIEGEHPTRQIELGRIQGRVDAGEWHGERDVEPAHRWEHTEGLERGGVDIPFYLKLASGRPSIALVVVKDGSGRPTALVMIELTASYAPGMRFHESWDPYLAHVELLSTCDDAPKGHATLAMARAMQYAKEHDRRVVYLCALPTAVAYYLNNCFGEGVHAFLIRTGELFEHSRTYALSSPRSTRDFVDIASVVSRNVQSELLPKVAFVLHGKDALAGLDYASIVDGPPPQTARAWLGRHVRMSGVTAQTPLVVGHTYEVVVASEAPRRTQAMTGYVATSTLVGRRKLIGAFVGVGRRRGGIVSWVPGEVATFANGVLRCYVALSFHPELAFRRTVRTHDVVDDAEVVHVGVHELDELPDAATLNFE